MSYNILIDETLLSKISRVTKKGFVVKFERDVEEVCMFAKLILREHASLIWEAETFMPNGAFLQRNKIWEPVHFFSINGVSAMHHISAYIVRDLQYFIFYVVFLEQFFNNNLYVRFSDLITNFQNSLKNSRINEIFIARFNDI